MYIGELLVLILFQEDELYIHTFPVAKGGAVEQP